MKFGAGLSETKVEIVFERQPASGENAPRPKGLTRNSAGVPPRCN